MGTRRSLITGDRDAVSRCAFDKNSEGEGNQKRRGLLATNF
ncbi:MAG: hypothetical protein ACOX86_05955 [Pelotomaculaceae bacterium]